MDPYSHKSLKARQRAERSNHDPNLAIRVHRALSWLDRAEQCNDIDAEFVFLWIAFNAAYAQEHQILRNTSTKELYRDFTAKIVDLDSSNVIFELAWKEYPSSIRLLLANKFVFQPYWDFENGLINEEAWEARYKSSIRIANAALSKSDTVTVVCLVLDRLYTLRNQLIHGGATWNGQINRAQLNDGRNFLAKLVPAIILIMMNNPDQIWGQACYPVSAS